MAVVDPDFSREAGLLAGGAHWVIGMDEVGRGAIAGPVAVGAVLVGAAEISRPEHTPPGIRDSKMLSEKRREALFDPILGWAPYAAVGLATPTEVDDLGITHCLGLAARRALLQLHEAGAPVGACTVLLDGNQDWLNPALGSPLPVAVQVKADRDCLSVAAASVLAKVTRDRMMVQAGLLYPHFEWHSNKGYGSVRHQAAIRLHGPSPEHRRTWLH